MLTVRANSQCQQSVPTVSANSPCQQSVPTVRAGTGRVATRLCRHSPSPWTSTLGGLTMQREQLPAPAPPRYTWWDLYNVSSFYHSLGHDVFILSMPLSVSSSSLSCLCLFVFFWGGGIACAAGRGSTSGRAQPTVSSTLTTGGSCRSDRRIIPTVPSYHRSMTTLYRSSPNETPPLHQQRLVWLPVGAERRCCSPLLSRCNMPARMHTCLSNLTNM